MPRKLTPELARAMRAKATPRALDSETARAMSNARETYGGGRPQADAPRCPCGAMTAKRAAARGHKC